MTGIIIITYNIPTEVFLLQIAAIRKFCKDKLFEIHVVDNSSKDDIADGINYHAKRLELSYVRTKASSVNGSDSHSWAANFIYERLTGGYENFLFIDHDCIPIREFSVEAIMQECIIAGVGQEKSKTYFWPGCVMWNESILGPTGLIDFSPNSEFGLDTGGNLYKVIDAYGVENCIFFNEIYCQNPNYKGRYNSYAMLNDEMFLHFINGSNWNKEKNNNERLNSLINIVKAKAGL